MLGEHLKEVVESWDMKYGLEVVSWEVYPDDRGRNDLVLSGDIPIMDFMIDNDLCMKYAELFAYCAYHDMSLVVTRGRLCEAIHNDLLNDVVFDAEYTNLADHLPGGKTEEQIESILESQAAQFKQVVNVWLDDYAEQLIGCLYIGAGDYYNDSL